MRGAAAAAKSGHGDGRLRLGQPLPEELPAENREDLGVEVLRHLALRRWTRSAMRSTWMAGSPARTRPATLFGRLGKDAGAALDPELAFARRRGHYAVRGNRQRDRKVA